MSKKLVITFEGIEGSGKSLHLRNVARYLKKKKIPFIKLREPGGSKNSEKIRKLILNKKHKFNSFTDLMLYFAARSENIDKVIRNNYKKKIILLDRFVDSTLAYQHYGMGLSKKLIMDINKILLKNTKPDFTFLNVISTKNLKTRLKLRKNKNRYDNFKLGFYRKVQKGYLNLIKNQNQYLVINSNKDLELNKKIVLAHIMKLIK